MKMIDVLNMIANGEIKEGTKLITDDDLDDYAYRYSEVYQTFMDIYMNRIEHDFNMDKDFLNLEVKLMPPKPKKYLVKFNMRGLKEPFRYLNYIENDEFVHINDKRGITFAKNRFTKDELQSIQPVKEFLDDMQGKYELIEVEENENN